MKKKLLRPADINRYVVIDKETGDVIADDVMFIGQRPYIDRGFRKIFVGFLKDVVSNKKIAGKAIRLLLWIIENLKPNLLEFYMSERIVCKELNIKRATYYNWVKVLLEEGLIERIDTNLYVLIPYQAVNGQMEIAINKTAKAIK